MFQVRDEGLIVFHFCVPEREEQETHFKPLVGCRGRRSHTRALLVGYNRALKRTATIGSLLGREQRGVKYAVFPTAEAEFGKIEHIQLFVGQFFRSEK